MQIGVKNVQLLPLVGGDQVCCSLLALSRHLMSEVNYFPVCAPRDMIQQDYRATDQKKKRRTQLCPFTMSTIWCVSCLIVNWLHRFNHACHLFFVVLYYLLSLHQSSTGSSVSLITQSTHQMQCSKNMQEEAWHFTRDKCKTKHACYVRLR